MLCTNQRLGIPWRPNTYKCQMRSNKSIADCALTIYIPYNAELKRMLELTRTPFSGRHSWQSSTNCDNIWKVFHGKKYQKSVNVLLLKNVSAKTRAKIRSFAHDFGMIRYCYFETFSKAFRDNSDPSCKEWDKSCFKDDKDCPIDFCLEKKLTSDQIFVWCHKSWFKTSMKKHFCSISADLDLFLFNVRGWVTTGRIKVWFLKQKCILTQQFSGNLSQHVFTYFQLTIPVHGLLHACAIFHVK